VLLVSWSANRLSITDGDRSHASTFVRPEIYTYADYYSWPDEIRGELLDGQFHVSEPAPSHTHQWVMGRLFVQVSNFFAGTSCIPCLIASAPGLESSVAYLIPSASSSASRMAFSPSVTGG
jgi:hypothetical protein